MYLNFISKLFGIVLVCMSSFSLVLPVSVFAHCDSLDGPVIITAQKALEKSDITPVLKWVKKEYEEEIKTAFIQTLEVRKLNARARNLADMYFFETLVRVHRAGEEAPYTGLKPAGKQDPVIEASDRALENGTVSELKRHIAEIISAGIQRRFDAASEAQKHADESVEAGRKFVEGYVEYVHYVERVFLSASNEGAHHGDQGESGIQNRHEH